MGYAGAESLRPASNPYNVSKRELKILRRQAISFGGILPKKEIPTYKDMLEMIWSMTEADQEEFYRLLEKKKKDGRLKSERS